MSFVSHIRVRVEVGDNALLESGVLAEALAECGADGFQELAQGLEAYFAAGEYCQNAVRGALELFPSARIVGEEEVPPQNWNALWESTITPVCVHAAGRVVQVHASFHTPDPAADIRIVVDPKMAFGTGHHATTSMMMAFVMEYASSALSCLDMGCGSGILAILAAQLGVPSVMAIDHDPWACTNARENASTNHAHGVEICQGDFGSIPPRTFDLVLANLTRNSLYDHMALLAQRLELQGAMAISGFYVGDVPMLTGCAQRFGLSVHALREQDGWAALLLRH